MKNKRMLSIGKFNFSPSLEQTPKALSSKNNFSFSMVGANWMWTKVLIKVSNWQTRLVIRLFWIMAIIFTLSQNAIGQQAAASYLTSVSLVPQKLRVERDSIKFLITGKLTAGSGQLTKQPNLRLRLLSNQDSLDLGTIAVQIQGGNTVLKKNFAFPYQPWMEDARLVLDFSLGKNKSPLETKVLAKGVHAPQFLVRLGTYLPGEAIPAVGRFDLSEKIKEVKPHTKSVSFKFEPGKSDWITHPENQEAKKQLSDFLEQNPELISLKITGLQSPEQAEGRNSQLGYLRAERIGQKLFEFFPSISKDQIHYQSRWNDWFDFRVLLADYSGLAEETKSRYYEVLQGEGTYFEKALRIKALPEFERVASVVYPKLRSAQVELTARPYLGLGKEKSSLLKDALVSRGVNKLSYSDWELAAAAAPSLDEKAVLYASMIKWFGSPASFINLAVIRMRQGQELQDEESRAVLWEEAARLLEEANRLELLPLGLYNQGQLKVLQGEFWEAYKILSEASVMAKENSSLRNAIESLRGALDVRRGDYKLALLRFGFPLESAEDWFNKGIASYLLGDYLNANSAFESSVLAKRDLGYGYYGLALVAMELGQVESGSLYLEKALSYQPALREKIALDPAFSQFDF
jgi:tetratricopeptide (TPR) repeat protein